jgi:hypothetical protein
MMMSYTRKACFVYMRLVSCTRNVDFLCMTSEIGLSKPIKRLRLRYLIRQGDRLIGQQIAEQLIFSGQILGSSLLPNYLGRNFLSQVSQFSYTTYGSKS